MFLRNKKPFVREIKLKKEYPFMYEGFMIVTQNILYLLVEQKAGLTDALSFQFAIFKFGHPNDEVLGAHPMAKYGLGYYGIFEVLNSPWIEELKIGNRIHPSHSDSMFDDYKHFIITYKDNTLDVISREMKEIVLTTEQISSIVFEQIGYLAENITE